MRILQVAFEMYPFVKVGGLADVMHALVVNMAPRHNLVAILPMHREINIEKYKLTPLLNKHKKTQKITIPFGDELITGEIWYTNFIPKAKIYFIRNTELFDRIPIYTTELGEYLDNPKRYIFFSHASLELCKSIGFKPEVIHCHDMQTGLIPAYLSTVYKTDAFFSETATVFTIHNIAYQGIYNKEYLPLSGISWSEFTFERLEYYDNLNFMKAGIVYANVITTVSPTYAKEIQTETVGAGLNTVLVHRASEIFGILNGIDYKEWNPSTDEYIASKFSPNDMSGKLKCKNDLLKICQWDKNNIPIFGMVSRLVELKGYDLLADVFDELMKLNLRIVILGMGEKKYHDFFKEKMEQYPDKFKVFIEFNNPLAHKIYAGCDFFLVPSRSEPCGLTQMISMSYGTIPIVHKTGGLADTVINFDPETKTGNGLVFDVYDPIHFLNTIQQAISLYNDKKNFKELIKTVMEQRFTWDKSIKDYLKVYRLSIQKKNSSIE